MVSRLRKQRGNEPVGPLLLVEEAVHVMRTAPVSVLAPYYIGALPFVLGMLFFWTDMSHGAFAESRLVPGSLGVAVAFVWMKAWQSVYARAVHDFITGAPPVRRTFRQFVRLAAIQGYHHALGLVALPLSFLAVIPFPWIFAYYQNVTVLGDLDEIEASDITAEARRQAPAWPLQNVVIMWLLSPFLLIVGLTLYSAVLPIVQSAGGNWAITFAYLYTSIFVLLVVPLSPLGAVVAVNLNIAISVVPVLARMWLGVETPFTQALMLSLMQNNTTTWAIVCGLAFLIMDPTMKAAYTLRCFYSQSRRTGADLEVGLRRVRSRAGVGVLVLAVAALAFSGAAFAQDQSTGGVDAVQLDSAIQETLQQREYAWRLPREYDFENPVGGYMGSTLGTVGGWMADGIRSIFEWARRVWNAVADFFRGRRGGDRIGSGITAGGLRAILLTAAVLFVAALAAYLLRRWYTSRTLDVEAEAVEVETPPDLEDENVTADALPGDEWIAMADDLLSKGEHRLAIRALFLAALARMGEHGLINIARYKSNSDYVRELRRRAHALPDHVASFDQMVSVFDRVWYGTYAATDELIAAFRKNQETVGTRA